MVIFQKGRNFYANIELRGGWSKCSYLSFVTLPLLMDVLLHLEFLVSCFDFSQYNCWKTYPEPWIYSYCIDFMLKKPCVKSQNLQKKPIWKKCSVGAGESIKENPPKIIRYLIKHLCLNNKSLPKGPFPPSRAWVGLSQRDQWAFSGQCTKLLPANTNTDIAAYSQYSIAGTFFN